MAMMENQTPGAEEQVVLYSVTNGIARITMNRPRALNAMNDALIDALHRTLNVVEGDPKVRVVVLTGAGKAFCAGGDLAYLQSLKSEEERARFISAVGLVAKRLCNLPKPVIAMVNGAAAGAGMNLMLACDFAYAAEKAKFTEAFAKVGLIPDCGGLFLLPRAVGVRKAKELMFTADVIDAAEALKIGLLNNVCTEDELENTVQAMAERLCKGPMEAIAHMKRAMNDDMALDACLGFEEIIQSSLLGSPDCAEGIAAFYEKRAPKFN